MRDLQLNETQRKSVMLRQNVFQSQHKFPVITQTWGKNYLNSIEISMALFVNQYRILSTIQKQASKYPKYTQIFIY